MNHAKELQQPEQQAARSSPCMMPWSELTVADIR